MTVKRPYNVAIIQRRLPCFQWSRLLALNFLIICSLKTLAKPLDGGPPSVLSAIDMFKQHENPLCIFYSTQNFGNVVGLGNIF